MRRASRQIFSQAELARAWASTRSAGNALARVWAWRISVRLASFQGSGSSPSASASARSSATSEAMSNPWARPANTASWSPRAAPPPDGIIAAASQDSMADVSWIVAMRAKRATSRS